MPRDPRGPGIFEIRDLPIIDTPFTRLCEPWFSTQKGGCADFEMDYVRCAARVGHKNVEKSICMKYMEDWMECAYKLRSVSPTTLHPGAPGVGGGAFDWVLHEK